MISPRYYLEYAYPHAERLVADLKAAGVMLAYHICGNATPVIVHMEATGATIIEIDQKADTRVCKNAALARPLCWAQSIPVQSWRAERPS